MLDSENFKFFISKENKLWRLENLYLIIDKDGKKVPFRLNRAQRHFYDNYLKGKNPFHRHIILKSRQLGFTTFIILYILDEIIFSPNKEGLAIAHTKIDASEIFNRKVRYALRNLPEEILEIIDLDQSKAGRVQFAFPDESVSALSVSNSGRSSTNHFLHISEFAKLCKSFPQRAQEVITGTIPSLSFDSFAFIESTAEGQGGEFYEMFMRSWKKKELITPTSSKIEWYPHFYNWTWDDMEMDKITEIIPVDKMEECEIDWQEYKTENNLSDREITYYYLRWLQLNKDIDKLHQEYPTNVFEAFVGSGSAWFSARKTAEFYEKCNDNYKRYTWINGEFIEHRLGELYIYKEPLPGKLYVIGGDVSEGLVGGDFSTAVVLGFDKEIKAIYQGTIEPDEYSRMVHALGKKFNYALLAIEFNKDGNWVNTDLQINGYPNIYQRTSVDDITKQVSKSFGWLTSKKSRDFAMGEAKKHFNSISELNCRPLLEEITTFLRNKRGKPEAIAGKHDDLVMAWVIALAVLQGRVDKKDEEIKPSWATLVYS